MILLKVTMIIDSSTLRKFHTKIKIDKRFQEKVPLLEDIVANLVHLIPEKSYSNKK